MTIVVVVIVAVAVRFYFDTRKSVEWARIVHFTCSDIHVPSDSVQVECHTEL